MDDTSKYLIHASIAADGVVERSDVVGAVFGQTEGLLGEELDLRDLQQSSKVGRIDVEIESENGQSFGHITIASSLDRVETAILAASLETIDRVGPCQASVEVTNIEDVREAKRREVVERAKELLAGSFDESIMDSTEILDEVRESVRIEDIVDYRGLPAGPHVADSDAIIVVEGRADVLTLLRYGIKNAVAVEGTNVPDTVAELTADRTVTAFLDGDRGGKLILRELAQVGDVDYVVFAPEGRSVEDLARHEIMSALREKVPYDRAVAENEGHASVEAGDSPDPPRNSPGTTDAPATPDDDAATPSAADHPTTTVALGDGAAATTDRTADAESPAADEDDSPSDEQSTGYEATNDEPTRDEETGDDAEPTGDEAADASADDDAASTGEAGTETGTPNGGSADAPETETLRGHVREVIDGETGTVRLLDDAFRTVAEADASNAFAAVSGAETVPYAVVIDGELTQRVLDVAAQRGVEHVVARSTGEMVKTPVDVRVRTVDQLAAVD